VKIPLRFADQVATRSPPEANLPEGPSHKVAFNYYHTRDARREVQRPKTLADLTLAGAKPAALEAGDGQQQEQQQQQLSQVKRMRRPGDLFPYST